MKYRPLGKTGIRVSEIGFGAWAIGGPMDLFGTPVGWSAVNDKDSAAAMQRAYDLGINFFDTSDVYGMGHSEALIGQRLQGKDCVIATKVGNNVTPERAFKDFSTKHIRESIDASLKRLKRETIDIYQLHNPPPEVWQNDEAFELLKSLKAEGKIKSSGVSITSMEEGIHLIENGKVDCLQLLFNILNQEPLRKVIPLAEEKGIGLIVRVPLASGLLTGKFQPGHQFSKEDNRKNYLNQKRLTEASEKLNRLKELIRETGYTMNQIALAFILKASASAIPIPGAKNPAQVEQNASAIDVVLTEDLFQTIRSEFSDYNFFLRYHVRV
jgi:aryl-alcohol dehydrogenase-like predicted oxidoreductase